ELALEAPLDLVATSALLDLVSPQWLDRLIIEAAARRLPVYAALSYDGRIALEPDAPFDAAVRGGFNRHQLTDKGSVPALGPAAAAGPLERFALFGFEVAQGRSDWVFGGEDRAIQEALFAGWAKLAPLTTTLSSDAIGQWLARRRSYLVDGASR